MKDMNIEENVKAIKSTISNNKNALIDYQKYERFVNTDYDKNVYEVYKNTLKN